MGGGNDQLRTKICLMIDGKSVKCSSGGNKEQLFWTSWEVKDFKGKTAHIEIIDTHTGGWGHINVDHIQFSDKQATPAREKAVWLDYGRDNYAGVTWSDIPEKDGRRLFMGWMSNWDYAQVVPTATWRSAMTIARELRLKETADGLRLFSMHVKEQESLRTKTVKIEPQTIADELELKDIMANKPAGIEVELEFSADQSANFGIALSNALGQVYRIGFDAQTNAFYSDRTQSGKKDFSSVFAYKKHLAPRFSSGTTIKMQLFIDKASAELFADDGRSVITDVFFPEDDYTAISLYSQGGKTELKSGTVHELKSIWGN